MALLEARRISKHFEGTQALCQVDLAIEPATVHALVGENGAGKSTLGKILAGVLRPDAGGILWDGAPASLDSPMHAQRLGIGMIFQELDLFPHLTVAENLVAGNISWERAAWVDRRATERFCVPLLREVGLDVSPRDLLADLSIGQMQLVAIARALGFDARVLIMDEPTSSLSEDSAEILFALIAQLKRKGVSLLYVSHKMDEIFRLADTITVLRDGARVVTTPAGETNVREVIRMMVGREMQEAGQRSGCAAESPVLLRVDGVSSRKLRRISFELRAGEVLGVAGLVGSGRSSLAEALFGLDAVTAGRMELHGRGYRPESPAHAIASGIGLVPEDRKTLGLMMQMSGRENTTLAALDRFGRLGFVRSARERTESGEVLRRLRLKAASSDAPVATLSGGNQQKILLARWLLADSDVMILDDPTRGIDVGAKHEIYEIIEDLRAAGKGVILISSELPELLLCSDRILVLHEGCCAGILAREDATQERIMTLAAKVN